MKIRVLRGLNILFRHKWSNGVLVFPKNRSNWGVLKVTGIECTMNLKKSWFLGFIGLRVDRRNFEEIMK